MTVYVDLLFTVNFVINILLLTGAAALSGGAVRWGRLFSGAMLGALYSVLMFFPATGLLFRWGIRLVAGALIVWVGVPAKSPRQYFKTLICFFVCLFVFGGGMYAFYTFTSAGAQMVYSNGIYYVDLPLWLLLTLAFGFYGLIRLTAFWQGRKSPKHSLTAVEICLNGRYRTLTGLVDTGNALQDPISLAPVIIVWVGALRTVLPPELYAAVCADDATLLEQLPPSCKSLGCRLIPYRSITGGGRLLFAVHPDWVRPLPNGTARSNVLLALVAEKPDADGNFEAILHTAIL